MCFVQVVWHILTKVSGYLHDSADVSVWIVNQMVVSLILFLAILLFALVSGITTFAIRIDITEMCAINIKK
jgi:hypothetical protein